MYVCMYVGSSTALPQFTGCQLHGFIELLHCLKENPTQKSLPFYMTLHWHSNCAFLLLLMKICTIFFFLVNNHLFDPLKSLFSDPLYYHFFFFSFTLEYLLPKIIFVGQLASHFAAWMS